MGILDWFKNRSAQFDDQQISDELLRSATEKALTLTNPRLQVLPGCHKRLASSVRTTIEFLGEMVRELPPVRELAAVNWATDPSWRAFFVTPNDIGITLGRSERLRTLFSKYPELDEAFLVLGMDVSEQQTLGIAVEGEMIRRDVLQTSVSFSDHRTHICSREESRLRRLFGAAAYEYLLAQALTEIAECRTERSELEGNRSLLQSRWRMLQQQGPGLGSMFSTADEGRAEQKKLAEQLLANEQQLREIGTAENILEIELQTLCAVLDNPGRYLSIAQHRLHLNATNIVVDDPIDSNAAGVDFSLAEFKGTSSRRRAFVLARVARGEV
ncbi:MAG TPA: hypothetical protein PK261_02680, partial [Accumulibacter sp.]|nr:hypothetical protein [Accumulibacter sp.]